MRQDVSTALSRLRPVLELLADGAFHSGESLGFTLGVSRAAVWKQLKKLETFGLELEVVKGRGYRLCGGLDLLDAKRIQAMLTPVARKLLGTVTILDQAASTNIELLEQLKIGSGHGCVLLAEWQSAGRGRRGRSWVSTLGGGINLSLGWQFGGGVHLLEGLSLAVGVALARALAKFEVPDVRLKWPNDVWCRGRKLAGVLLELTGDLTDCCGVVIGIGLNMRLPKCSGAAIDQPWVDLEQVRPGIGRNQLVAAVVDELLPMLQAYPHRGFCNWQQEWQQLDQFTGCEVQLHTSRQQWSGVACGVDETGALLLEVDGETQRFHSGEVSLRAKC